MVAEGQAPDEARALELAIQALEQQRAVLGDAVVDVALRPLHEKRARLLRHVVERRKLVTVLISDLMDSTPLTAALGPEAMREVMGRYFAVWRRCIETEGGSVQKFIGDAVVGVFGMERSREDDPHRAVRAALAVADPLAALAAEVRGEYGVDLHRRTGIDTGEVVLGTMSERGDDNMVVVGESLNLAARLQTAAPVDGVLLSAATARHVRGAFGLQRVPDLQLKGIGDSVQAFLVHGPAELDFWVASRGIEGVTTRTVGRDAELAHLRTAFTDVVDAGRGAVLTLLGEAGIGKSRLLAEFEAWFAALPEQVWLLRGRADAADEAQPNALLRSVFAERFGIRGSDTPDAVRAAWREGVQRLPEGPGSTEEDADAIAAWLGFPVGDLPHVGTWRLDPSALERRARRALDDLLCGMARVAPVVVLLEDLHWADTSTLDWLAGLQADPPGYALLVVATTRPPLLERRPQWGEGLPGHRELRLAPLSRADSDRLVDEVLQRLPLPPAWLRALLVEEGEGNPFFVEELVAWLVDRGTIRAGEGAWSVADAASRTDVPGTLRALLEARLDVLGPDERDLTDRASVIGRVFWDRAVAHLADGRAADAEETYQQLRAREVVQPHRESAFAEAAEFTFRHALVRDVAYGGLLAPRRRRYHALAAEWMAQAAAASGRADENAARVAQHLVAAGSAAQAAPWFLRAGRHAAASHANEEALRLLGRARDQAGGDPALLFEVLVETERVLDRVGDREHQRAVLADLVDAAGNDPARRSLALTARGRLEFFHAQYVPAAATAEEAEALAREAGRVDLELDAMVLAGRALAFHADHLAARDQLGLLLQRAREAGSGRHGAEAQRLLGVVATNLHDEPEAIERLRAASEEFRAIGDRDGEGLTVGQLGAVLLLTGRREEAWAACEEALAIFVATGHRLRQGIILGNMVSIAQELGRLDEAIRTGERTLRLSQEVEDTEGVTSSLQRLGDVHRQLGDLAQARAHLERAVALGVEHDLYYFVGFAHTALALVCLAEDDTAAARGQVTMATDAAERAQVPALEANAGFVAGLVALGAGVGDEAAALLRAAADRHAELGLATQALECTACLAGALLDAGRPDEAAEVARRVVEALPAQEPGLVGWTEPGTSLPACHRVLVALGDPAADAVARAAAECLAYRSEAIVDPQLREQFLATDAMVRLAGIALG